MTVMIPASPYLSVCVDGCRSVLLSICWFDQWAQDRLDHEIDNALALLNDACACGDPNEVTVTHSPVGCSVKRTHQQRGVSDV